MICRQGDGEHGATCFVVRDVNTSVVSGDEFGDNG